MMNCGNCKFEKKLETLDEINDHFEICCNTFRACCYHCIEECILKEKENIEENIEESIEI